MTEIMNQISQLQQLRSQPAISEPQPTRITTDESRVALLQKQLDDLTHRRLDYLEKMHKQQLALQVK